jgi:hypothetical protein
MGGGGGGGVSCLTPVRYDGRRGEHRRWSEMSEDVPWQDLLDDLISVCL